MAQRASELRAAAAAAGGSAAPAAASTASALRAPYGGGGGYRGSAHHAAPPPPDTPDDVFFGGVSALAEHLDRTMLLVLRDGRLLFGALSSYDQYGSVVLEGAKERLSAQGKFADIDMGLYMIRGENIMLMGELVRAAGAPAAVRWPPVASLYAPLTPLFAPLPQDEALDAANPLLTRADRAEVEDLIAADLKKGAVKGAVAGLTCVAPLARFLPLSLRFPASPPPTLPRALQVGL